MKQLATTERKGNEAYLYSAFYILCIRVARGSGQKIYRYEWVGSGPVRLMTKCIVKFCDACHIIHYNNELKKFHVVFYVYGDQAM